jgi:hypothetical protein
VKDLGLPERLGVRPFSNVSLVLVQLIVGSMNMVIGLLAVTFYSLNVSPTGVTTSPTVFLQISVLAFIFGILSFAVACLGAVPALNYRATIAQTENRQYANYPPPRITTREYVTQRRQTILEQAWTGLACPSCGRAVSYDDNFCDVCGTQFWGVPESGVGIRRQPETTA